MIGALLLYKLKSYLKREGNPWRVVLSIFLIINAVFYGFLFGTLTQLLESGTIENISKDDFIKYTLLLIFVITPGRMIFPGYKPLKQLFPKYYPLSITQRYAASLINDFLTPYFFYLSLFIVSGSLFANTPDSQFLVSGFLFMICAHLLRRCIQYMLDFSLKPSGVLMAFIILLILAFGLYNIDYWIFKPYVILTAAGLFFVMGWVQEWSIKESRLRKIRSTSLKTNLQLKLLFNNPKVKLPLLIGFSVKTGLLLLDFFLFRKNGVHLFNGQFVYWLFVPPLIYFTYVFNNIWAFWFNLWLNLQLRIGDYKAMIIQAFFLMLPLLIIDAVITLPILLLSWDDKTFILTFYFTTTFSMLLLSFLWSLITSKKIATTFQINGSTSTWGVIVSMGSVFLLSAISKFQWAYLFVPLFLVLSAAGLWYSIVTYKNWKYVLFNKLKKG
ncbi:MAG: hypothetical protein PHT26_10740 [Lentimicrobiaceae bacterium]|nr:hypothetical protein [Lentimicrobiaceae bacterium]